MLSRLLVLCLLYSSFISATRATESPDIVFFTDNQFIHQDIKTKVPTDVSGAILLMLFTKLDIWPELVDVAPPRASIVMQQADNISCTPLMQKNEARAQHYLFSKPLVVYLTPRLYQQADDDPVAARYLNNGEISSLPAVFNDTKKLLLLMKGRSYGSFLDGELARIDQKNIRYRYGGDPVNKDLQMLTRRDVNYVLTYPQNVFFLLQHDKDVALRSYRITGSPSYSPARIMCNKTAQSAAFLEKVNAVLPELYDTPEYLNSHIRFNPPGSDAELADAVKALRQ